MTPSRALTDDELDARIRAAGVLLDAATERRMAERPARRRRVEPSRALTLAAAVVVVVAIGSAAVISLRDDDDPTDRVRIATTTTEASTTTTGPVDPVEVIREIGAEGVILTRDALVDLVTGELTPLVGAGDTNGTQGSATAVSDDAGGIYYLSHDPEADPDDPDDFGSTDLRHLSADGTDEVVRSAVSSFAMRSDGALAMAVRTDPITRNGGPWNTDVVVVAPDGSEVVWSPGPAEYEVVAWSGERVLGERRKDETEAMDVVVFDRPGEVRDLGEDGTVHAVAADRGWVVLSRLRPGEEPEHDSVDPPRLPEVVDVASGFAIGSVTADEDLPVDVGALRVGRMSWVGDDRFVAPASVGSGTSLVAEMEMDDNGSEVDIRITRVAGIDPSGFFPDEVWEARDGTIYGLGASSDQRYDPLLHVCRRGEATCEAHDLPFDQGQLTYLDGSAWR